MIEVSVPASEPEGVFLAPLGITTPHGAVLDLEVQGGRVERVLREPGLGLAAAVIRKKEDALRLRHAVADDHAGDYPQQAFAPRDTRYTRAAADLVDASRNIAGAAGDARSSIEALVREAEMRFTYAHPDMRFNDGLDSVPYLSCGLTPGSCVDINTYLVAALRAAGIEAGYFYGYFFPAERDGITNDMHCWVVTRCLGEVLEWDIAHHMKAGLGPTRPCLNPRPGTRVALGHSLGQTYCIGCQSYSIKLLAEPMRIDDDGLRKLKGIEIRNTVADIAPVPEVAIG